jgi:hypothetical protein
MQSPTIGRQVWYRPGRDESLSRIGEHPLSAQICGILSDTRVNIYGADANGNPFARQDVPLLESGASARPCCEFAGPAAKRETAAAMTGKGAASGNGSGAQTQRGRPPRKARQKAGATA